jgi:hypothetical protein
MPVESGQAQARRLVGERPPGQEAPARPPAPSRGAAPAVPAVPGVPGVPAAPRPPHDEHELPDGRYLLAYRSAPDA